MNQKITADQSSEFYGNAELIGKLNFAANQLELKREELARILGLHSDDVSDTVQLQWLLESSQPIRHRAERFVLMFLLAEKSCLQENVTIKDWFHQNNEDLNTTPCSAVIEQARIEEVIVLCNTMNNA